jgi:subtilisin-like proprotein convertase family protein
MIGQPMKGNWILNVSDRARQDVGKLKSWKIELTSAAAGSSPPSASTPPVAAAPPSASAAVRSRAPARTTRVKKRRVA